MATPVSTPHPQAVVSVLVRRLQHAHDAAWDRLVGPGLRGAEHAVLVAVHHNPGIEQGTLAALVSLQRSTMADVGRRLEQRELIVRRANPFDARSKQWELTGRGEAVLHDVADRLRALDGALLADDDAPVLLRRLAALADRWDLLGMADDADPGRTEFISAPTNSGPAQESRA